MGWVSLICAFLIGLAATSRADMPLSPGSLARPGQLDASLAQETRAALDRGLLWLTGRQNADGHWDGPERPDLTALPLLTFMASPDPAHRPIRERGLNRLTQAPSTASAPAMVFTALALAAQPGAHPAVHKRLLLFQKELAGKPLPAHPRELGLRLAVMRALSNQLGKETGEAFPWPAATQQLARVDIRSITEAAAVLLGGQAAGAARNDPLLWKAFNWIARHREIFESDPTTPANYEDLMILAMALAQSGENRISLQDHSLLAWRPVLARTLINRQKIDPATGGIYWMPAGGNAYNDALTSTCYALLTLQLVLAE
ncbi:MAG: hypothetical protein R6X19_10105 [Kiritimatiellia bacterium]